MNLRSALKQAWSIPDRSTIQAWAERNVTLPSAFTVSGRFAVGQSRYLFGPLDALGDDLVRTVTVVAPVRSGKTLIADVWVPWIICCDPGPCMFNLQTDVIAKRHAETRQRPILDACPLVVQYYPVDRHKLRSQEIIFRHGMPLYIQGPSIGNLQSVGMRYQINDEIWMWEPGRHAQAVARTGDFEAIGSSKVLNISQAGIIGDDLDTEWRRGHQGEWHVKCLGCGHQQPAVFSGWRDDGSRWGMTWDDVPATRDKLGRWIVSAVLPTVRWACRACGHAHVDDDRTHAQWALGGEFVPMNPTAPRHLRSFHWTGVVTRRWSLLVEEFLEAMNALKSGVVEPLMTFTQKRDAQPWAEEMVNRARPAQRTEIMDSTWKDEAARFLTIDRQAEGLHWGTVRAWSKIGESHRLWFGKLYSEAEIEGKAAEHKVRANHVFIDSGYDSKLVYAMCVRHGWIALKGDQAQFFAHHVRVNGARRSIMRSYSMPFRADPEIGRTHEGRAFAVLIRWSNRTIKDRLQRQMDRGLWIEPPAVPGDEMEAEYATQMRGQWRKMVRDRRTGKQTWEWLDNGNDHARDCACMQVLGATLMRILPDMETEEKEAISSGNDAGRVTEVEGITK